MPKIAVIGDVMLDTYHYVDPIRSAPEGCLIHRVVKTEHRPGAAANVADCLETLGWDVTLFSHTGHDQASKILQSWASACGIHTQWIPLDRHQNTRENTRYYYDKTCLLRADMPNPNNLAWDNLSLESLTSMDAVVLYDKGSLRYDAQDILTFCHKHNIKTYVDPSRHHTPYPHAYLVKANEEEANILLKTTDSISMYKQQQKWENFIITRDMKPVQHWDCEHNMHEIAFANNPNNIDPTGAGDAFFSALITAEWENYPFIKAIAMASLAGSLALNHIGTYAPTRADIKLPPIIKQ